MQTIPPRKISYDFTATLIFVSNLILTPQPWVVAQQFSSNQKPPDRSREVLLKFVENCYFQSSISPLMLPHIWCVAFQIWSSKPISAVLSLAIVVEILYKGSNFSRESKKTITTTFWGGGVFSGWYYNRWLLDVDSDIFITILHLLICNIAEHTIIATFVKTL